MSRVCCQLGLAPIIVKTKNHGIRRWDETDNNTVPNEAI